MGTQVNASALKNFTPSEGGSPLLSRNGIFKIEFTRAEVSKSKTGNTTIDLEMSVLPLSDEDPDAGQVLTKSVPCTGTVQKGRNKGDENILQLGQCLASAGWKTEDIQAIGAKGTLDLDAVCTTLLKPGKNHGYVACNARAYNGYISSDVSAFIAAPRAEKDISNKRHKQPYSLEALEKQAEQQNAARTAQTGAGAGGGGSTSNGVSKPADTAEFENLF